VSEEERAAPPDGPVPVAPESPPGGEEEETPGEAPAPSLLRTSALLALLIRIFIAVAAIAITSYIFLVRGVQDMNKFLWLCVIFLVVLALRQGWAIFRIARHLRVRDDDEEDDDEEEEELA